MEPDPALAFFPNESAPDLYAALSLAGTCTPTELKAAYRRAALQFHPDKLPQTATEEERTRSSAKFQQVGFAYAVLKDEDRRKRYDSTGRTDEGLGARSEEGWKEYFNNLWTGEVNANTVDEFTRKYQGSEEETQDLFKLYTETSGSLETILVSVMCSTYVDEDRFIALINAGIASKVLPSFPGWKKSIKDTKSKERRKSGAIKEALEAEKYAKELGVHEKLYSKGGKGKGKGKANGEDDEAGLRALIQSRQAGRMESVIDSIEAKYGAMEKERKAKRSKNSDEEEDGGGKKRKKQEKETEPSEEEFQKLQKQMEERRKSLGGGAGGTAKRGKGRKSL